MDKNYWVTALGLAFFGVVFFFAGVLWDGYDIILVMMALGSSGVYASWVSAFATVAIAILTVVLAKETWALRKAQNKQVDSLRKETLRPQVSVTLEPSPISSAFMMVVVRNRGRGVAKDISFVMRNEQGELIDAAVNDVVDALMKINIFSKGIRAFGIEQEFKSFLFSFRELSSSVYDEVVFIEIDYFDVEGTQYADVVTIDLSEFKGLRTIGGGDPLYTLADEVKKLRTRIEKVTSGNYVRLNVNTFSSLDRDQEKMEERRVLEEYEAEHAKN
ncbi:hypothetical protein [Halodesulfovibrio sp.]|jgi:hypothetical protein|uniref:hypothetical protein n=1 Tax=Halodesulfovibrio sp. TaxID=1912772 RepID=UPI0025E29F81|nr:hypothetical protein [Halodesulfovibrio sp.]MCT4628021.1 hypothetical protein [Halodesulfovibrio sp.]